MKRRLGFVLLAGLLTGATYRPAPAAVFARFQRPALAT